MKDVKAEISRNSEKSKVDLGRLKTASSERRPRFSLATCTPPAAW